MSTKRTELDYRLGSLIDMQDKHLGQLIFTGPSHAARKDLQALKKQLYEGGGECLIILVCFHGDSCDNNTKAKAKLTLIVGST